MGAMADHAVQCEPISKFPANSKCAGISTGTRLKLRNILRLFPASCAKLWGKWQAKAENSKRDCREQFWVNREMMFDGRI